MKTSALTGKKLDHWVSKARGWELHKNGYWKISQDGLVKKGPIHNYTPSTNGGQCFKLMQTPTFNWVQSLPVARVDIGKTFEAQFEGNKLESSYGPTLNIAICRAFVASVYGDEVDE